MARPNRRVCLFVSEADTLPKSSNPYMKATVVGVSKDDIQYLTNMKTSTAQKATPTNYAWDYEMIFEVSSDRFSVIMEVFNENTLVRETFLGKQYLHFDFLTAASKYKIYTTQPPRDAASLTNLEYYIRFGQMNRLVLIDKYDTAVLESVLYMDHVRELHEQYLKEGTKKRSIQGYMTVFCIVIDESSIMMAPPKPNLRERPLPNPLQHATISEIYIPPPLPMDKTAMTMAVERGHKDIIEVLKTSQSKVITPKIKQVLLAGDKKEQDDELQQFRLQVQLAEERAVRAEQRVTRTEQKRLETQQQNDTLLQQMRLQVQRAEVRATRAEEEARRSEVRAVTAEERAIAEEKRAITADERAMRADERATIAEQELVLSRQQSEAQLRYRVSQSIPQHSDYMKSSWKIGRDEIEVIEGDPLGAGGWGEVRVAMFRGVRVAAKFLHKAILSHHNISLFLREMNMAACVRHPNLLLFIGASLDDDKPVILTELMPANLRSIIPALSRVHAVSIGTDVARGLNYLHLMRPDPIIHRDISSANILVERTESGGYRAKVSDYGSVNFVSRVVTTGPGNASYAAPESSNPKLQSPKMDVYSYGILLLEMATGQFPDQSIQAIQLDTMLWQEMKGMIRRCICEDPANRPTMKNILALLPQLNK